MQSDSRLGHLDRKSGKVRKEVKRAYTIDSIFSNLKRKTGELGKGAIEVKISELDELIEKAGSEFKIYREDIKRIITDMDRNIPTASQYYQGSQEYYTEVYGAFSKTSRARYGFISSEEKQEFIQAAKNYSKFIREEVLETLGERAGPSSAPGIESQGPSVVNEELEPSGTTGADGSVSKGKGVPRDIDVYDENSSGDPNSFAERLFDRIGNILEKMTRRTRVELIDKFRKRLKAWRDVVEIIPCEWDPNQICEIPFWATGGTAGSEVKDGAIAPAAEPSVFKHLRNEYPRRYRGNKPEIEFLTLSSGMEKFLSENFTTQVEEQFLKYLSGYIRDYIKTAPKDCPGLIIQFGSDNTAYLANKLSLLLGDIPFPVVITSSNYILDDDRANGVQNCNAAAEFIRGIRLPGVYVAENSKDKNRVEIIYGPHAIQSAHIIDKFRTATLPDEDTKAMMPLGYMENGKFYVTNGKLIKKIRKKAIKIKEGTSKKERLIDYIQDYKPKVHLIDSPSPGYNFSAINLEKFRGGAVVLGTYHANTIPWSDDGGISKDESVKHFAEACDDAGVELIVCPVYKRKGEFFYDSLDKLYKDTGAILMMNGHFGMIAQKVKVAFMLYPNNREARLKYLDTNTVGEFLQPYGESEENGYLVKCKNFNKDLGKTPLRVKSAGEPSSSS